ncbi:MAG: hypothetical protein IKW57_03825 [Alphaproteobacteria bacterium]|nr:hypothetical protein [Alphaproteobacteria bacterium]
MRKILMSVFVGLLFLPCELLAETGCGLNQITLSGLNQYPDDDEFLFDSMEAFNSAPRNNGTHTIKGTVWECDNEYCGHDVEKQMEPGHVFMGQEINERRLYKCVTNGLRQSHWVYEIEENLCGETHISYDGNQQPDDNEFLYENETAYNSVKNRPDGGTVTGGRVFECDNKHCPGATQMPMPAGHVFMGQVVKEPATYICNSQSVWSQFDDRWERLYDGCVYKGIHTNLNDWYADSLGTRIVVNYSECSQWQDMNPADEKKSFHARCEMVNGTKTFQCYPVGGDDDKNKKKDDSKEKQCKDGKIHGYEWEVDCVAEGIVGGLKCGKRCNYNGTTTAYVTECQKEYNLDKLIEEDNPVWTGKYKRCVEKKKPGETKQQKCEKSWGTWRGDNGGCVCDANKGLKLDNGECVCLTDKHVRDESTKSCILPDADKQKQECEKGAASGAYWDNGKCKCRDIRKEFVAGKCTEKADIQKCKNIAGAEWSDSLDKCVCKDSANMEFNENMTACVEKAELREKRAAAAIIVRVKEIKKNLSDVQSGLKVSKWKDAQGNFNTARLASDSVAGVVLGTAGALITSSVVKKNQVENGFEDLKCTVGGQIVADWGDQFQVGIQ